MGLVDASRFRSLLLVLHEIGSLLRTRTICVAFASSRLVAHQDGVVSQIIPL